DTVGAERMCRLEFAGVTVPDDRVLGEVGSGQPVVEAIERYGAAATCAEMVGGAQGVLDRSVEYATQREQFGKPIGAFQAVQHHCANMAIDVLGSRFLAYEAIWRLSAGQEAATEVSAAKAWVSEAYQRVCALGHQVHGAIGFTAEHDLHAYFRHAISSALAFGDGDFHTELLARKLGL
ncbi:MAG: acyl-CoA dehydrogenase family protein, partial [Dehalococcoidia bacterium]